MSGTVCKKTLRSIGGSVKRLATAILDIVIKVHPAAVYAGATGLIV